MVIRAEDRVADVLAHDERLVEVFAAAAPAFARLRSRALRRTMARLVTVEQAARIAGLDPAALLDRLNASAADAGASGVATEATRAAAGGSSAWSPEPMPVDLRQAARDRIADLDVRDDLRSGREPLLRIMAAVAALPADGVLRLAATFEPVPLFHVLEKRGLRHWTERLADDHWRVWFFRGAAPEVAGATPLGPSDAAGEAANDPVVLDVRGLEPPEPMVRTLAALDALPAGATLVQLNVRPPQFLLPRLEEMGYTYRVDERQPNLVRVFIHKAAAG